ncbi:MAG: 3-aminobutyryl-CoA ammonia-lyase, partial [uncultured Nocardioidaceae bacterium]
ERSCRPPVGADGDPPQVRSLLPCPLRGEPGRRGLLSRPVRGRRHRGLHPHRRRRGAVRLLLRGAVPGRGPRRGPAGGPRGGRACRSPVANDRVHRDRRGTRPTCSRRISRVVRSHARGADRGDQGHRDRRRTV